MEMFQYSQKRIMGYFKIEKIDGSLHRKIFLFPGIEYERDYDILYINVYILKCKINWRVKVFK